MKKMFHSEDNNILEFESEPKKKKIKIKKIKIKEWKKKLPKFTK